MSDYPFTVGEVVHDRNDDTPDDAIVVNIPPVPAREWDVFGEKTLAEDNPDYPVDATTIVIVYEETLDEQLPDWERDSPIPIDDLIEVNVNYYAFPAPRLESVTHANENEECIEKNQ